MNEEGEDVNEGRGVVTKNVYGSIGPFYVVSLSQKKLLRGIHIFLFIILQSFYTGLFAHPPSGSELCSDLTPPEADPAPPWRRVPARRTRLLINALPRVPTLMCVFSVMFFPFT